MKKTIPGIVEIVGPAGAGKTTLCDVLSRHPEHIRWSNFPDVRKISDAPFFVWHGICSAPLFLACQQGNNRLSRRQYAWMSILRGWPALLRKEVRNYGKVILLDQGPTYLLAEMSEFGPEYLRSQRFEKLWKNTYHRWANTLDMIVWLDAGDEYLIHRIRTREQEHIIKDASDSASSDFLSLYRAAYNRVISMLTADNAGPRILRFDTGRLKTNEIADQLMHQFAFAISREGLQVAGARAASEDARL